MGDETGLQTTCRGADAPAPKGNPDAVTARVAAFRVWLGTVDMGALTDRERVDVVAELERVKGASSAAQARAVHELRASRERVAPRDVGRSVGSEVALARRESPSGGDRFVGLSRALVTQLPVTMRALTAGECSERHALVMARVTTGLNAEHRAEVDRRVGPLLPRLGWTRPSGPPGASRRSWTPRRWWTGWRRRSAPAG
jgi:hypothetical protein